MDMTGERRIPAPRLTVWEALNNPEVLKASIPGCESLEKLDDDQMKATASVKVGPISARFTGKVQLTDIDPPNGYRISGEGQGGVAGFAKGGANVALTDDGADTLLSYQVNAQVGGKLAQLGGRLIDATAKQMADAFFDRFSKQVQAMSPPMDRPVDHAVDHAPSPVAGRAAASPAMAEPIAVATYSPGASTSPPSSISIWSLIPREPFGLPVAAWIGGGIFLIMVLLMLGSML
jgi:carbon monoxide dehydrogenase subunit G